MNESKLLIDICTRRTWRHNDMKITWAGERNIAVCFRWYSTPRLRKRGEQREIRVCPVWRELSHMINYDKVTVCWHLFGPLAFCLQMYLWQIVASNHFIQSTLKIEMTRNVWIHGLRHGGARGCTCTPWYLKMMMSYAVCTQNIPINRS